MRKGLGAIERPEHPEFYREENDAARQITEEYEKQEKENCREVNGGAPLA